MRCLTAVAGGMASIMAIVLVSVCVAGLGETSANTTVQGLMGSVFAPGSALGYVVVGLLGLVLGVTVTLLSARWGEFPQRGEAESPLLPHSTDGEGDL